MLLLDALAGKNRSGRPPIWLMRQAGRYMHEYLALRQKYDFYTLCHTPELVCEVTELPVRAFGFDAAILFSDILWILEALGAKVVFDDGIGPIVTGDDLEARDIAQPMQFVYSSIKQLKKSLTVPLIGFAGAPFTVASYFLEGKSSATLERTKKRIQEDRLTCKRLIDTITDATILYLQGQIKAGADVVQIFDSWAMHLTGQDYADFVLAPLQKIVKSITGAPIILFCRGSIEPLMSIGAEAISVDWQQDLAALRKRYPSHCLQGNLNPDLLLTDPDTIEQAVLPLLDTMKNDPAYIFNLGHGIHKDTPRQNVEALVSFIKNSTPHPA